MNSFKLSPFLFLPLLISFGGCTGEDTSPPPAPLNLKCEYKVNPLGIDNSRPRLFWEISNQVKGTGQTAYQVLMARDKALLSEEEADVWDSGRTESDQNIQIEYGGEDLKSSSRYYWKVRFWDQEGTASDYSPPAWFETSFLPPDDWKALWIYNGKEAPEVEADHYQDIPAPLFRVQFKLSREVERARLYITGLGYYEAYINGTKTGDYVLNPGWTNYAKRIQYNTYDVTDQLTQGNNAIGVILGNGWYNALPLYLFNRLNLRKVLTTGQPRFIAQLKVEFTDGSDTTVLSNQGWTTSGSPILRNNVYLGEKYDARLEQEGWSRAGFDESLWKPAVETVSPGGRLVAQIQAPIRITREVKPIGVTEPQSGVFVFDMGQNFAGNARLKVNAEAGTRIQLRYGELLHDDGTLNDQTTIACHIMEGWYVQHRPGAPKNADQRDIYITKGGGEEIYSSRFTFHGFRYVEVTGFPGIPDLNTLTGQRMNTDLAQAGEFESSNELLNQIQENTRWTFLSNVFSIESDCPGREKFGYGGDIVTAGEAYIYNYDMPNFYIKTVRDFQDDQKPSGGMPECAPDNAIYDKGLTDDTGPIGWMIAHPFLIENLIKYYGDLDLMEEQYESFKRLTDFITGHAKNNIIDIGISDHGTLVPKDEPVTGTAFYYYCAKTLSEFAHLLGNTPDESKYSQLANQIRGAFVKEFLDTNTGAIGKGTQADQNFALYYDLVPDREKEKVLQFLLDDIIKNEGHGTSGIFGTKFLFNVLHYTGNNATAYRIADQREFPSFGYMIENEATTIWESWKGGRSSYNHPMYGSISEWFFRSLVGISPDEGAIGFDRVVINPSFPEDLSWVNGSYKSVRGRIICNWKKGDEGITMDVSIPGNTSALVHIPASETIQVDGAPVDQSKFVKISSTAKNQTILKVEPGAFSFQFEIGR